MGELARGYSWPPFEPGNEVGLRHGAYSPRRVDPLARELVDQALGDPDLGYLAAPSYRPALWAWARAEAQVQLLAEYLERFGADPDFGDRAVSAAYNAHHRAEARADSARRRLGLDPLSRARLGRDVTAAQVDLVSLLTDARERQEAEAAAPGPTPHPPTDRRSG
ncbi:hypothetical protein [Pseudonocardia sp. H11422]|uniref:hypothetical protein n=1 Tax=Pseudonocardia sp. H11422 TaxID=2835866 RepID=UPI001BDD0E62|nr:hypothetical protein [Pseudonocardia sp. H11422]